MFCTFLMWFYLGFRENHRRNVRMHSETSFYLQEQYIICPESYSSEESFTNNSSGISAKIRQNGQ